MTQHSGWKSFAGDHRLLLIAAGLPDMIARSEHRYRELLETGQFGTAGSQPSLEELKPSQWSAFYQFTQIFFREFESYSPETLFLAFRREVLRRGDKFPR